MERGPEGDHETKAMPGWWAIGLNLLDIDMYDMGISILQMIMLLNSFHFDKQLEERVSPPPPHNLGARDKARIKDKGSFSWRCKNHVS